MKQKNSQTYIFLYVAETKILNYFHVTYLFAFFPINNVMVAVEFVKIVLQLFFGDNFELLNFLVKLAILPLIRYGTLKRFRN